MTLNHEKKRLRIQICFKVEEQKSYTNRHPLTHTHTHTHTHITLHCRVIDYSRTVWNQSGVLSISHSVVSDSEAPWAVACQAHMSMEFFRQEYWSGLPFPSPGDLPDPGIKPRSPALQADSLPSEPPEKPN